MVKKLILTLQIVVNISVGQMALCPTLASAQTSAQSQSHWGSFCERLLDTSKRVYNAFGQATGEARHRAWLAFMGLFPGGYDWFEALAQARLSPNRYPLEYHDKEWHDPVRLAHTLSRVPRQLKGWLETFRTSERRSAFNRDFLAWELRYLPEKRPRMRAYRKQKSPKYIAVTLDDVLIDRMVARDFPDFARQKNLRAVEVVVSPVILFGADRRQPRVYRRFTLLILKDDLVVKAYPALDM